MPLIDMPMAELEQYAGRNPCPADHAAYWDRGLAEMRALDPAVDLTPHPHSATFAECFHLYFTGTHNARIHAKLLKPVPTDGPHPAVVFFHGYHGSSGDWNSYLGLVAQGYTVAALDCRGQGGLSEDAGGAKGSTCYGQIIRGLDDHPDKLLFRQIFLDCAQLTGIVMDMPEVDENRVGVTGQSQGGGLTLACAALEPRVKRAMPVFPFLSDYLRVWEMDLAIAAYEELRTYLRLFDPLHQHIDQTWEKLGYIDVQHLAPRIRAEVKMAIGMMDTVCPPSTQFAAYNKITAPKSLLVYPDFTHEALPGLADHVFEFMAGL